MEELLQLRLRLERARARCDAQRAFSPDWGAARADIEDVSRLIWGYVPRADRQPAEADR